MTKKNTYLLLIFIGIFLCSLYVEFNFFNASVSKKTTSLQSKINAIEQKEIAIANSLSEQYFKSKNIRITLEGGFNYGIYEHDSLINWNNPNGVPLQHIDSLLPNHSIRFYNNAYFLVYKKVVNNLTYLISYPIYFHYNFPNKYLRNGWNNFKFLTSLELEEQPNKNDYDIKSSDGSTLFHVKNTNDKSIHNHTIEGFFVIIYLFIFTFLAFLIFQFLKNISAKKTKLFFAGFAILLLIAIFYCCNLLQYPFSLHQLGCFNPEIYASKYISSLGSLFFLILLWFAICTLLTKYLQLTEKLDLIKLSALYSFQFIFTYYTCVSLVNDSSISFSVFNYDDFNLNSVVALLALCLQFVNLFLLLSRSNNFFENKTNLWIGLTVAVICLLFFAFSFDYFLELNFILTNSQIILLGAGFIVAYYFLQKTFKNNFLFSNTAIIATLALFGAFVLNQSIQKKELNNQISLANYLGKERDEATEFLFDDVYRKLEQDKFVTSYFSNQTFYKQELLNHLKQKYFNGYFNKYDVKLAVYKSNNLFYCGDKKLKDTLLQKADTVSDGLFYFTNSPNETKYVGRILFKNRNGIVGKIIVQFSNRAYKKETVYPSLVLNFKSSNDATAEQTNYAIYNKNILKKQSGSYPFPFNFELDSSKNLAYIENDYHHFITTTSSGNIVWISTLDHSTYQFLSFFCLLIITVSGILILRLALYHSTDFIFFNRMSFRNKLLSIVTALIFFTLFITAFLFVFYSKKELNNLLHFNLSNKIENVQKDMLVSMVSLSSKKSFHHHNENSMEDIIQHLSMVHDVDINLFDLNGNLISSSQNLIFENNILAPKIRYDVLKDIVVNNNSLIFKEEKIGTLNFLSAYVPIADAKNRVQYILNVPYFFREKELTDNFNNLIISLIIVYVLLILFAVLLSYLISNNLTKSFEIISKKMSELKLGKKNELIEWNRNDEIGSLVNEYNKMILQLENSAEKLAQNERESAWREMAKQVAHEIKNPLTPMKLSIQMLERAIIEKREDVNDLSLRVSKTLVEQIDNLAQIATQFSQFAKISSAHAEQFNLIDLLENVTSLYAEQNPSIKIELIKEDAEAFVFADKNQFLSVFNNLVLNAIQAIPENIEGKIVVEEKIIDNKININISDNGRGIEEDKIERIFEPNFTTKSSGTGLGLAIAKAIIQNAGGEITVKSVLNERTIFEISLPKHS